MSTLAGPETINPLELASDMKDLVYQVSVCEDPFAEMARRHEEHGEAGFYTYSECSVFTGFMSDGVKVRLLRGQAQIGNIHRDGTKISFECDAMNQEEAESVIRITRKGIVFTFETRQQGGASETVHTGGGPYNLSNLAASMSEGAFPSSDLTETLKQARNALNKVFGDGIDK